MEIGVSYGLKCVRKENGDKYEKIFVEFSYGVVCCYIGKNRYSF